MEATFHKDTEWTKEHEKILVEWCDKSIVYRWLHQKSHQQYKVQLMWFTIPVIILSTITGTANFAQDRLPERYRGIAQMAIGGTNIFAGILTTIQQFLKISELNEAHRVSAIAWDKFYRNTKIELAKAPNERTPVVQLLKISKDEYDRLSETSPMISDKITKKFQNTFSDGLNKMKGKIDKDSLSEKQLNYLNLIKPEICDSIETSQKYVYQLVVKEDIEKQKTIEAINLAQKAIGIQEKQNKIETIIKSWKEQFDRNPTEQEIINELDDMTMADFVKKYFKNENVIITDNNPV